MARLIPVGDTVTAGERRMLEHLSAELGDDWLVLGNPWLISGDLTREVDAIVIGPRRVVVLDDKGFWGVITGDTYRWTFENGRSRTKVLNTIEHAAAMASGVVKNLGGPFDKIWTEGLVVMSADNFELRVEDDRVKTMVVRLGELVERLEGPSRGKSPILSAQQRSVVAEAFSGASIGARARSQIDRIGSYSLTERLGATDLATSYLAQRIGSTDAVELKLYDMTAGAAGVNEEARYTRAKREYDTLYRMRNVPGVLRMADSFQPVEGYGEELYYFTVELPGGPTLASRIADDEWTLANRLRAMRELIPTVAEIHRNGAIHRSLSPDVVWFWNSDHEFKVGGFESSRLPGSTLGLNAQELGTDSYMAPEVAADRSSATEKSDIYSVAAITWEVLTRSRAFADAPRRASEEFPPIPAEVARLPGVADVRGEIDKAMAYDPASRSESSDGLLAALKKVLGAIEEVGQGPVPPSHPLAAGARLGEYRVREYLGSGGAFHAYLVENADGSRQLVARVARDPDRLEAARAEFAVLAQLDDPNIVRPVAVNTDRDAAYHMLEEFSGPTTARDLIAAGPSEPKVVAEVCAALASALVYLETRKPPVRHGDITPSNIAINSSGPKLIDFGLAHLLDQDGAQQVIGTAPYRPPERDVPGVPWPDSGDLYSLGVVAAELLFGHLPYDTVDGQFRKHSLNEQRLSDGPGSPALRRAIRATIHPDAGARTQRASEFRDQLFRTPELASTESVSLVRNHVDRLANLLSLFTKGDFNAENRGLDSAFARDTYVRTELDDNLLPDVLAGKYALVVLTGNPGDGKTAFIQQVLLALGHSANEPLPVHHWVRTGSDGLTFEAVLDGSASDGDRSLDSDGVIDALLKPFEIAGDPPGIVSRVRRVGLLAVNDGRLLEYLDDRKAPSWLVEQLLGQLGEVHGRPHPEILVADLNNRSLAHPGEADVVSRVIASLIGDRQWDPCTTCIAASACHVRFNVDSLQGPLGDQVTKRIRDLILLVHSRGRLHVTMRELRSALAYTIFGDQDCEDIHSELESLPADLPNRREQRLYWNRIFGAGSDGGRLLGELADLDPGGSDAPKFDREVLANLTSVGNAEALFAPSGHRGPIQGEGDELRAEEVSAIGEDSRPELEGRRRWSMAEKRRRAFFELRDDGTLGGDRITPFALTPLAHSRMWFELLDKSTGDRSWSALRDRLCRGVSLTDDLPEAHLDRALAVRTNVVGSGDLTVVRLFPIEEFSVEWEKRRGSTLRIGDVPTTLVLGHGQSRDPSLEISIDLFELLLRAADGFRLGAEELESVAANLRLFKDRLLALPAKELVLAHRDLGTSRAYQEVGNGIRAITFAGFDE